MIIEYMNKPTKESRKLQHANQEWRVLVQWEEDQNSESAYKILFKIRQNHRRNIAKQGREMKTLVDVLYVYKC